jgi:hypothetical protein
MHRMSRVAAVFTLVIASVIVYHNALRASFFDDDFQWLVGSWSFHPSQLVAFSSMSHFYRPVIDVYFAALTPLLGGSPVFFHAVSIAIHVATVLVIFALATRIGRDRLFGFCTALFFAVQPADIDAVAWVGALAEAVGAFFGCLALFWFLRWRDEGHTRDRWLSLGAYAVALLTHESSVVFLAVMVVAEWLGITHHRGTETRRLTQYSPFVAITVAYLTIDLNINSRNYVVTQGDYSIGFHMTRNALDYLTALYVGRHDALNDVFVAVGLVLLLWLGNERVRFATLWILLALAPFLPFTWGNTSRYLYQPAIGFAILLAEGVRGLGRGARTVSGGRVEASVASLAIAALIAIRFAVFAQANVTDFAVRSQVYPAYLAKFRRAHPDLTSNTTVQIDPDDVRKPYQFVNAAVQWEYRDPTIRVAPYE